MNVVSIDQTIRFEQVNKDSSLFPVLRQVFHDVLEPLYGNQDRALEKIGKSEDRICELMLNGDAPVGVFQYKTALQDEYGLKRSLEVKSLFVVDAKENSGKGFGSKLVFHAEEVARRHFADTMHLTVSDNCQESQRFFVKKGFKKIRKLEKEYIPGVSEYLFTKKVQSLQLHMPCNTQSRESVQAETIAV